MPNKMLMEVFLTLLPRI